MRTLAIGDIHGAATALDALLAAVAPTPQDLLVFLGDYVDRGPDSKGVLDRLIALSVSGRPMICLRGNHELMMLRSRTDRSELKMWLSVGGMQALGSYAVNGLPAHPDSIPPFHWEFLERGCVDYFETDTHIFVHANLDSWLPMEEQPEMMLFWEFMNNPVKHLSGKRLICGHTSQRSGVPRAWRTTVCIDTNAYYPTGWLTCLDVHSGTYWQANEAGQTRVDHLQEED
jgi:serine/threonine protein phosphatase 1